MNSLRIKGFPGGRWRLIPCKEGEERAGCLSWWEKGKKKKVCSALMQNSHFRQLEIFLHLSLDGGQFRREAGASEEINELQ